MRIINVSLAVLTIILSVISIIFPKNLYLYPIGLILLGILNLLSGLRCIKEGEKLISRFLLITVIIVFAAAASEFLDIFKKIKENKQKYRMYNN